MFLLAEDDPRFSFDVPPPLPQAKQTSGVVPVDLISISAAEAYSLLEHESVEVVAALLAAQQWQWAPEMLSLCSVEKREAILATSAERAPALVDFVLRTLAERLRRSHPV